MGLYCAFIISAVIVIGQVFHYPSAVKDAVTGGFPEGIRLTYPWAYHLFAPFFQIADHFTILGKVQHFTLLAWLIGGWFLVRLFLQWGQSWNIRKVLAEAGRFLIYIVAVLGIVAAIVLLPRPMARLAADDPDILVVNFHSHSLHSWDGRKSFSAQRNLNWHARAGFHANFITDHNRIDGSKEGVRLTMENGSEGILSMRGEEVSLFKSHWVLLGNEEVVDNSPYDRGPEGIERFLKDMRKDDQTIVIASLPEYWRYHRSELEEFVRWGVDGFEIINSAPQSLDFTSRSRSVVMDLCRRHDLIMTGVTDSHGWGSTVQVWNAVRLPDWRALERSAIEPALMGTLRKQRAKAVQVLVRVRSEPKDHRLWLALDPLLQIWEASRSMPLFQAVVSLIWLWLPCLALLFRKVLSLEFSRG